MCLKTTAIICRVCHQECGSLPPRYDKLTCRRPDRCTQENPDKVIKLAVMGFCGPEGPCGVSRRACDSCVASNGPHLIARCLKELEDPVRDHCQLCVEKGSMCTFRNVAASGTHGMQDARSLTPPWTMMPPLPGMGKSEAVVAATSVTEAAQSAGPAPAADSEPLPDPVMPASRCLIPPQQRPAKPSLPLLPSTATRPLNPPCIRCWNDGRTCIVKVTEAGREFKQCYYCRKVNNVRCMDSMLRCAPCSGCIARNEICKKSRSNAWCFSCAYRQEHCDLMRQYAIFQNKARERNLERWLRSFDPSN